MEQTTIAPARVATHADLDRILIDYSSPTSSVTIFDFQPFPFAKAREAKQVIVELMAETKTRYHIGVRFGEKYESVYIKPAGCDGLKFYEKPMVKRATGERFNYYYFVAGKKQGVKALEDFIRRVVIQLFDWYDKEENFKVTIWAGRDYRLFQSVTQ